MTTSYTIAISPIAQGQLDALRVYDHRRIFEAIGANLLHEPLVVTRNRKPLDPVPATLADLARELFLDVGSVWELRVRRWRVAYVVNEAEVHVIWVFPKERQTTGEALS